MNRITGKEDISYSKEDVGLNSGSLTTSRTVIFKDERSAGDLVINTQALNMPSEAGSNGFVQPGAVELNALNLLLNKKNLRVHSSRGVWMQMYEDFMVTSGNTIQLIGLIADTGGALEGEVFTIYAVPIQTTNILTTDAKRQWQEYILADGDTVLNLAREYEVGKNLVEGSQLGAIRIWRNGVGPLLRNVGNAVAAPGEDGNYHEVSGGTPAQVDIIAIEQLSQTTDTLLASQASRGQTFTPASDTLVDSITFKANRSTVITLGTFRYDIKATLAGVPTGPILASTNSFDMSLLPVNPSPNIEVRLFFPTPFNALIGVEYAIEVVDISITSGVIHMSGDSGGNPYAGGAKFDFFGPDLTADLWFKIFTPDIPAIPGTLPVSTTVEFNNSPSGQDDVIVVEFGMEYAGDLSIVGDIESVYGGLLAMANDVGSSIGIDPLDWLTPTPSQVERNLFGDTVLNLINRVTELEKTPTILRNVSATFTPTNSNYMSINQFHNLEEGIWRLQGLLSAFNSGVTPEYQFSEVGFYLSDGASNPTVPDSLGAYVIGGAAVENKGQIALPSNPKWNSFNYTNTCIIRVTSPITVFMVPRNQANIPANMRAAQVFTAEKIGNI